MNRKQFLILLILLIVVGGAGLVMYQRGQGSWESNNAAMGGKLLPNLAVNDIAAITIKTGTNTLHLARDDKQWRVRERGNYPANFSQISQWLIKLSDMKIAQSQDVGPSQLGRFDLLPAGPGEHTGTLVEFADAGAKPLASLLLGKKHIKKPTGQQPMGLGDEGWPDGRYVQVGGVTTQLDVVSDAMENADPKPDQWLDKDFLNVEKPSSIAVEFPETTNSWKLSRASETNDWQLDSAKAKEKLDADKISGVTTPFSSASFSDVLPPDTSPAVSGMTNVTRVTVKTFDGFSYAAQIGQKQADNFPVTFTITANLPAEQPAMTGTNAAEQAKAEADAKTHRKTLADKLAREQQYQKWIYLMPSYTVDPILKNRADLLVVETNAAPATTGTNSMPEIKESK